MSRPKIEEQKSQSELFECRMANKKARASYRRQLFPFAFLFIKLYGATCTSYLSWEYFRGPREKQKKSNKRVARRLDLNEHGSELRRNFQVISSYSCCINNYYQFRAIRVFAVV